MTRERRALGRDGEARAERFLAGLGYGVLERSCRTRWGEVDLVMRDGETIVFVEVKTRSGSGFALPEESVGLRKQRKLAHLAAAYLQSRRLGQVPVRFDVIAISGAELRHIPDAFSASGFTL